MILTFLTLISLLKVFIEKHEYSYVINFVTIIITAVSVSFVSLTESSYLLFSTAFLILLTNNSQCSLQEKAALCCLPLISFFIPLPIDQMSTVMTVLLTFFIFRRNLKMFLMLFLLLISSVALENTLVESVLLIFSFYLFSRVKTTSPIEAMMFPLLISPDLHGIELLYKYLVLAILVVIGLRAEDINKNIRYSLFSFILLFFWGERSLWAYLVFLTIDLIALKIIVKLDKNPISVEDFQLPHFYHLSTIFFLVLCLNQNYLMFLVFCCLLFLYLLKAIVNVRITNILNNKSIVFVPAVLTLASGFFYNNPYSYFGILKMIGHRVPNVSLMFLVIFLIPVCCYLLKFKFSTLIDNLYLKYRLLMRNSFKSTNMNAVKILSRSEHRTSLFSFNDFVNLLNVKMHFEILLFLALVTFIAQMVFV